MTVPLNMIEPGQTITIEWLANDRNMAERLVDLGFETGAKITCVLKKGNGEIAAYLVRNAVIALRREDSQQILVKEDFV